VIIVLGVWGVCQMGYATESYLSTPRGITEDSP
jgi:hypothetical protein